MALSSPHHGLQTMLEEELECGICLERLKSPRLLTCQHSFCDICLRKCMDDSGQNGREFPCPVCRYVTILSESGVAGLRPDFRANKFLKALEEDEKRKQKIESSRAPFCDLCESPDASVFCVECNHNMCTVCTNCHMKMPICRRHKIYSLQEVSSGKMGVMISEATSSRCAKHNEQLKFYCNTCSTPICSDCTVLEHNKADGHNCVYLNEIIPQLRNDLQTFIHQVQDKQNELESYNENMKATEDDLLKRHSSINKQIANELEKIGTIVFGRSNRQNEDAQGDLRKIREKNDSARKAVSHVLSILHKVSAIEDDGEVARIYQSLQDSVQNVVSKQLNREDLDSVRGRVESLALQVVQNDSFIHPGLRIVYKSRKEVSLHVPEGTEISNMWTLKGNEIAVIQENRDESMAYQVLARQSAGGFAFGGASEPVTRKSSVSLSGQHLLRRKNVSASSGFSFGKRSALVGSVSSILFAWMDRQQMYNVKCEMTVVDSSSNVCFVNQDACRVLVVKQNNDIIYIPTDTIRPCRVAMCQDSPETVLVAQLQPATVSRIGTNGKVLCTIREPGSAAWEKVGIASDGDDNVYVLSSTNSRCTLRVFNEHGTLKETIFKDRPMETPSAMSKECCLSVAVFSDGSVIAAYIGGQNVIVIEREEKELKEV